MCTRVHIEARLGNIVQFKTNNEILFLYILRIVLCKTFL